MKFIKNSRSFVLPLGIAIIPFGYIGYNIRIYLWKHIVERQFKWPKSWGLLNTIFHLLPCVYKMKGGIYGTSHGDFYINKLVVCWFYKRWVIIDWNKK